MSNVEVENREMFSAVFACSVQRAACSVFHDSRLPIHEKVFKK
jgi:hypothetical protein